MSPEQSESFVRQLTSHRNDLFRYIFALLPNEQDAQDALQETSVALSRKFGEYDPTRPFILWACRFAYFEVLKQRARNRRAVPAMDEALLGALAAEREDHAAVLELRLNALDGCLEKLPVKDRVIIGERYGRKGINANAGLSKRTYFRNLERIRRVLMACIDKQVE